MGDEISAAASQLTGDAKENGEVYVNMVKKAASKVRHHADLLVCMMKTCTSRQQHHKRLLQPFLCICNNADAAAHGGPSCATKFAMCDECCTQLQKLSAVNILPVMHVWGTSQCMPDHQSASILCKSLALTVASPEATSLYGAAVINIAIVTAQGSDYFSIELARLQRLLEGGKLSPSKLSEITRKVSVLGAFQRDDTTAEE